MNKIKFDEKKTTYMSLWSSNMVIGASLILSVSELLKKIAGIESKNALSKAPEPVPAPHQPKNIIFTLEPK